MKNGSILKRLTNSLRFEEEEDELTEQTREFIVDTKKSATTESSDDSSFVTKEEIAELPVDVYELPNEIIIQTLIAGVMPEHLSISIARDNVKLVGKREENRTINNQDFHIKELYWGQFERVITLPAEVDIDGAEAIERHGMLIIKLPKLDRGRKNMLQIKSI